MSKQVRETWTGMHGLLVCELAIEPGADPGTPSIARIFCRDKPADYHLIEVCETRESRFNLRFAQGCYVFGTLRRRSQVNVNGVLHVGIFADIHFGFAGKYDEQHFEGFIVIVPLVPIPDPIPPDPIIPEDPDPFQPDLPIINETHSELFPYVYVRKWPTISPEDLNCCFVQYVEAQYGSPPASTFYDDLVVARAAGRDAMQDLALTFIEGESPYAGQFVTSPGKLSSIFSKFPQVRILTAQAVAEDKPDSLVASLEALYQVQSAQELSALFNASDYVAQLDLVWQSYFALIIILGYDRTVLAQLIDTLDIAHLLAWLCDSSNTPSKAALQDLLVASIVLPPAVFPLPPASWSPPCASPPLSEKGWIEPYAIGDLQLVRQRLLRYAPGEIAHIENVMRGEKREIGRRRTHRQVDYNRQDSEQFDDLNNEASDVNNNLQEETRRTIAEKTVTHTYDGFQTTYGPPTEATLNGNWSESTTQGANPGSDENIRFARVILNKTVNRIAHRVNSIRSSSTLNESEDTVKSTIDNTTGTRNFICVFHWLNKVYEAYVVNYGNRLMIEFMLCNPAANFILEQQSIQARNFSQPASLQQLGITSFQSIDVGNYATLAATYEVTDIEPPPPPLLTVTATLRSGQDKLAAIPPGYSASTVFVTTVEAPNGLPVPVVLVGRETFQPDDPPNKVRNFGENTTMPISVAGYANTFSPPTDSDALVNVSIACRPSSTLLDTWRIKTYNAILCGYQKQLARYDGLAGIAGGGNSSARSPLVARQIERDQIKAGCVTLLLERYASLTGSQDFVSAGGQPSEFSVNEPRYIQFFDEVFEWDEMSYSFQTRAGAQGNNARNGLFVDETNRSFAAFLNAGMAKIMVPARPSRTMALLYFLSSGALWDGDNRLAPTNSNDIALVNDLKASGMRGAPLEHRVGRAWEVVVPTAMQVIGGAWPNPQPQPEPQA